MRRRGEEDSSSFFSPLFLPVPKRGDGGKGIGRVPPPSMDEDQLFFLPFCGEDESFIIPSNTSLLSLGFGIILFIAFIFGHPKLTSNERLFCSQLSRLCYFAANRIAVKRFLSSSSSFFCRPHKIAKMIAASVSAYFNLFSSSL